MVPPKRLANLDGSGNEIGNNVLKSVCKWCPVLNTNKLIRIHLQGFTVDKHKIGLETIYLIEYELPITLLRKILLNLASLPWKPTPKGTWVPSDAFSV